MLFRDMVRLAGRMKEALRIGLREASLEAHITECNLFVKANKERFGGGETAARTDYGGLVVSMGPVAPVAFYGAALDGHGVFGVNFEKNPLHARADAYDKVYVYAYCPALGQGQLSLPALRRQRKVVTTLPAAWDGCEVVLYGMVQDRAGRTSNSCYIDWETSLEERRLALQFEAEHRQAGGEVLVLDQHTRGKVDVSGREVPDGAYARLYHKVGHLLGLRSRHGDDTQ